MTFVCKLTFTNGVSGESDNVIDFMRVRSTPDKERGIGGVYGDFKWSRNINKNAIYVQLPVGKGVGGTTYPPLEEGGYGYDLGFVQDNFVLDVKTTDYAWYEKLASLIKINTGEVPAKLTIGPEGHTVLYNVLIRYCNFTSEVSGEIISMSVTLTVVSKEYAPV